MPLERMLEMAGRTVGQGDVGKPMIDDPRKIDPEDQRRLAPARNSSHKAASSIPRFM